MTPVSLLVATQLFLALSFAGTPEIPDCLDPTSIVVLDTLEVEIHPLGRFSGSGLDRSSSSSGWNVDEIVGSGSNGSIVVFLDPATLEFYDHASLVDATSYGDIIDLFVPESVAVAHTAGYILCGDTVSVRFPSCALRTGTGLSTAFSSCGTGCCERTLAVECTPSGSVSYREIGRSSTPCNGSDPACEPGCGQPILPTYH